jgi:Cdc6-like AAA superfamily ATPase
MKITENEINSYRELNDYIGRTDEIKSLCTGIQKYFEKPELFENNVVFIDGKWGSGKTWFIKKVLEYLDDFENEFFNSIQVLNYNSWQYFDISNIYYDLIENLYDYNSLENIELVIKKGAEIAEVTGEVSSKMVTIIDKSIEGFNKIVNLYQDNLIQNDNLELVINEIPFVSNIHNILKNLVNLKNGDKIEDKTEKLIKLLMNSDFEKIKFETINSKSKKKSKFKKSLLIIDDIDRADEKSVWKLIMILNLFQNKDLLFILIGSREYIKSIIDHKYHLGEFNENFIEKFIGLDFTLQLGSNTEYISKFVDKMGSEFGMLYYENREFLNFDYLSSVRKTSIIFKNNFLLNEDITLEDFLSFTWLCKIKNLCPELYKSKLFIFRHSVDTALIFNLMKKTINLNSFLKSSDNGKTFKYEFDNFTLEKIYIYFIFLGIKISILDDIPTGLNFSIEKLKSIINTNGFNNNYFGFIPEELNTMLNVNFLNKVYKIYDLGYYDFDYNLNLVYNRYHIH